MVVDAASAQSLGYGHAYPAAAQHQYRFLFRAVRFGRADKFVVSPELFLRSGQNEHRGRADDRGGTWQVKASLFPEAHHVHTGQFAQAALGQGLPLKGGTHGRSFSDAQFIELTDDVGLQTESQHATRELRSERFMKIVSLAPEVI